MTDARRSVATGAILGLLLGVSLRALLSTAFYLSLATLRLNWTALWLLVLLAPALAPLVPRTRWLAVAAALGAAALPLARFTPWYVAVAALATGAALLAVAHLPRRALPGVLVGVALDGALLLAGHSHDLRIGGLGAAVALAAALLLARAPREDAEPASVRAGVAWGALLLAESAFLASPYAAARFLDAPAWLVAAATLAGLALGLLARRVSPRIVLAVGALALVDVQLASPLAPVSLLALQAALAASVLRLGRPNGVAFALAIAPAAFGLLYFGQVLGPYEWGSVALLALVLLAAPAWRAWPRVEVPRAGAALVLAGLLAVPVALLPPTVEPHAGDELVVVTWNVHQGFGNRGALDPHVYADTLRALRPDVLLLTEADTARLSSGGLDVVAFLARELGLHAHTRASGLAILSRFPLADPEVESVGWTSLAALDVHGQVVHVQAVHLARSREERAVQVQQVLAEANATRGPRILAGDLNSCAAAFCFGGRPSDRVHEALATAYQDAWTVHHEAEDPAGYTHPSWQPRRRIDVVFVRELEVLASAPVRDERTVLASDHLPVLARLRLPDDA